jgi:hypothetical protein
VTAAGRLGRWYPSGLVLRSYSPTPLAYSLPKLAKLANQLMVEITVDGPELSW